MAHQALRIFLAPGNMVCSMMGTLQSDDRMMVRTLINMLVWNFVLVVAAFMIF